MPRTASAMRSEARGPSTWTPRTRSVRASATILTSPSRSAGGAGPPVGREREPADARLAAGLAALLLGEAHAGQLRPRVDHARNRAVVDVARLAGQELGAGDALLLRLVGEHRPGDGVADGVDARGGGLEALVDGNPPARVEGHAERLQPEPGGVGAAADRDEDAVERLRAGDPARLDGDGDPVVGDRRLSRGGAEREREPLALEDLLEGARHLEVHARGDAIEDLDDVHLRAEPRPHRAQLEADRAGADHGQARRHRVERERLLRGDDPLAVEIEAGKRGGLRAGRDQDARALEKPGVGAVDLDASGRGDPRAPGQARDPVLFEEALHAVGEALHDPVLPGHHRAEVHGDVARPDAVRAEVVARRPVELARVEQGLRGDAADAQARAAERRLLVDAGHAHAELGRADGGDVAAGAGADHDQVVRGRAHLTPRGACGRGLRVAP